MTLVGTSIDFLTAGQAFHWFDSEKARGEFQRLLKPSGWVVLIWNERQGVTYPLGNDYELLSSSYYPEAGQPGHELILSELRKIFDAHQIDGWVDFFYMRPTFITVAYSNSSQHPDRVRQPAFFWQVAQTF